MTGNPRILTRMARYLVACYAAEEGGHFRAHRDNTTRGTAHRRFAVSINLNTDFEGGEVSFPEYGPRGFKMPAGAACVFSCSLLHEALPVTKGRRFTLLTFLSAVPAGARAPSGSGFNPGGFAPGSAKNGLTRAGD